ncbi:MAG: dihydroorotase [Bacteriovoracaceae bacterium]
MILLQKAQIISSEKTFSIVDIVISQNKIQKISPHIEPTADMTIISVNHKLVSSGFIDMHVHLREPGYDYKETIHSGTLAGARGGFTFVACMSNTNPALDNVATIRELQDKIKKEAFIRVSPIGALTMERKGVTLAPYHQLKEIGVVALSDDGDGIQNEAVMKEALIQASLVNLPVMAHCEDCLLAAKGALHAGEFAQRNNIRGISSASEFVQVRRDIALAEQTGGHYHVCHISAKESIQAVREAKAKGLKVSCEVTPHHILLSDSDIPEVDCNFKMNPPLRAESDRKAIIDGLLDGTIDIIATDHAPHTEEEKAREIHCAPFGVVGLETAFPLLYTHLVLTGTLSLKKLVELMTIKPAQLFSLPYGKLEVGSIADLVIIDLENERVVDPNKFLSKGKNTPFKNWKLKGWPTMTIVDGQIAWRENEKM